MGGVAGETVVRVGVRRWQRASSTTPVIVVNGVVVLTGAECAIYVDACLRTAVLLATHRPFYYCGDDVASFADMAKHPSPICTQMRTSYAPLLLSIECWDPHVYAGQSFNATAHVRACVR